MTLDDFKASIAPLDRDDLREMDHQWRDDIANLRRVLDDSALASVNGQPADPGWLRRTKRAMEIKIAQHRELQTRIREFKRDGREQHIRELEAFRRAAREVLEALDPATYELIKQHAQALLGASAPTFEPHHQGDAPCPTT